MTYTMIINIVASPHYEYGIYEFDEHFFEKTTPFSVTFISICEGTTFKRILRPLDCAFVHYLVRELMFSSFYRRCYINTNKRSHGNESDWYDIRLMPTRCDLIDYNWNERVNIMVRERLEVNNMFSWLSTLGGAFSALGDHSENCAVTAGKISVNQFKLALRLGDPGIQARCRLYFALSLIQRKYFRYARNIIQEEFQKATATTLIDNRLVNMCKGIWSKLQYDHRLAKCKRRRL